MPTFFEVISTWPNDVEIALSRAPELRTTDHALAEIIASIRSLPRSTFEIEVSLSPAPQKLVLQGEFNSRRWFCVIGYASESVAAKIVSRLPFFLDLLLDQLWLEEIHDDQKPSIRKLTTSISSGGLHQVMLGGFLCLTCRVTA